jgi:hypothetical protein
MLDCAPQPSHSSKLKGLIGRLRISSSVLFDPEIRFAAYLDEYVIGELPEATALKSNTLGTIDGTDLPPRRVFERTTKKKQRLLKFLEIHAPESKRQTGLGSPSGA